VARNIIQERSYEFDAAAGTLVIPRYVAHERFMLITNVTQSIVMYNFSDPALNFESLEYQEPTASVVSQILPNYVETVLTFAMDTTSMSNGDNIQIIVDDWAQTVTFEETTFDPAQKIRMSAPQSLMDTDFEYSVQPSKWEALFLQNNYPSFFAKPTGGNASDVFSIVGDGSSPRSTITVTTNNTHGFVLGQVISVQETQSYLAEGTSLITFADAYTFKYTARGIVSGDITFGTLTTVYGGDIFDGAHIPGGSYPGAGTSFAGVNSLNQWTATTDGAAPISTVTAIFQNPHGVYPGTPIVVSGTNSFDGNYTVNKVATTKSLQFQLPRQQSQVTVPTTGLIATKGDGYVQHRPYDGGVSLTTGNNTMGAQTIRQTRRYFRYQSGKGIQFSTGAQLTPVYDVEYLTLNGGSIGTAYVTVNTVQDHGLQAGVGITMEGVETNQAYNPYNGDFIVTEVINNNTFRYPVVLTSTVQTTDLRPAGVNVYVHAVYYLGAVTRCGMYDDQNGFYFEYDGAEMYVVRRHSEKEGMGRIAVIQNSSIVTGTNTNFRKQINAGQTIVIKGSTYRVVQINSDTSMNVSPAYRGPNATGMRYLMTQVNRVAQDEWNIDKFDGTGPSGYQLNYARMQMIYIDYTWYGAGTIRFGMRSANGKVAWCHRMSMNNINNTAYQRSGNLPARYEVANDPLFFSRLLAGGAAGVKGTALGPDDLTLWVEDTHDWPAAGYVYVRDDNYCEIMQYSSLGAFDPTKGAAPIYLTKRRASISLVYPDQPFTYSGTTDRVTFTPDSSITGSGGSAQVSVQSITQNCAPMISHWGSSVIMDGRFDNDQNFIFTGGMIKYATVEPGVQRPLIAVRLAPSVDNAIARGFGIRELINRMQLQMNAVGVQTNGSFRLDGLLNPLNLTYTKWTANDLVRITTKATGTTGNAYFDIGSADTSGVIGISVGMVVTISAPTTRFAIGTTVTAVVGPRVYTSTAITGSNITTSDTVTFTPKAGYLGIPDDWGRDLVGSGSLAQVLYFDNTGPGGGIAKAASGLVNGGDSVFSFYTENGSASSYNSSTFSLLSIRDLGNSILSGNGNVSTPGYPNAPDILVIAATNIGTTTSNISARISWNEAQA
jgi:hypothetical protein